MTSLSTRPPLGFSLDCIPVVRAVWGWAAGAERFTKAPAWVGQRLEVDNNAGGRLGGMSEHAGTERGQPEVRAVIHEAAVFQAKRDMLYELVVNAPAINKCGA